MHKRIIVLLLAVISLTAFSQKKKEVKKYRIRSVTSAEVENGKTTNDNKTVFDSNGEVAEETNYDKDGALKSKHIYKYNSEGDVVEDVEYDKSGVKEKRINKYNSLGEKTEESIYDKDGKLLKKHVYIYDSKGLKTNRKTYDAANKLLSEKKYTYEYK